MNFDEQILEAAKSIAAATAALVKSASAAQRELISQGKVNDKNSYFPHSMLFVTSLIPLLGIISSRFSRNSEAIFPLYNEEHWPFLCKDRTRTKLNIIHSTNALK